MKSSRSMLVVGQMYPLHVSDTRSSAPVLECIRLLPGDAYSEFNACVRSVVTGWTMNIHGVNMYEDGSIDWDFSTHGIFTDYDGNGILHERSW